MKNEKSARFFCDSCDSEVVGDALFCPKCGKIFSSVRCPACNYSANHSAFMNGCPECGYAMHGTSVAQNVKLGKEKKKKERRFVSAYEKEPRPEDALPAWVYIFCIVLLGLVIVGSFIFLT